MAGSHRRRLYVCFAVFALVLTVLGYVLRESISEAITFNLIYEGSKADWELKKIRERVRRDKGREPDPELRIKCLEIAAANVGTSAEMSAYVFIAKTWPESGKEDAAFTRLLDAADRISMADLARSFKESRPGRGEQWPSLAARLIQRVDQHPDDPSAARLLCDAALACKPVENVDAAPAELMTIANMIQERYATSPVLSNFCEVAGNLGTPAAWSRPFEPHVRHILEVNQDRLVRCSAHFALASIIHSFGIERQTEAAEVYEDFLKKFDGWLVYDGQSVEQNFRQTCRRVLETLQTSGLGMHAPDTNGVDLDGIAINLKDYRDRVVLVSFWASWCRPCLEAIPHERELLQTFGQSDFAIFGMNADSEIEKARAATKEHGIEWRSLRTDMKEVGWNVSSFPTFYLLDKQGVIVRVWQGLPQKNDLDDAIRSLIGSPSAVVGKDGGKP